MKVIFMGTPDFALPTLNYLLQNHEVIAVYTQMPKMAGRGNKITKTPVHELALENGVEVVTVPNFKNKEDIEKFKSFNADIAVVAAYGLILPQQIIDAPKLGTINVHASLLPRWRGAAPIERAIEAGDKKSGVTIMEVVQALDAGRMYMTKEVQIDENTTGQVLHDKLALEGAVLLHKVLSNFENILPVEQDENLVTYAKKIDKAECEINFNLPADVLLRKIKAFSPYPAMFFEKNNERFKILDARVTTTKEELSFLCSDGKYITPTIMQRQGKKPMNVKDLLNGLPKNYF